jgi:hypothetical protein
MKFEPNRASTFSGDSRATIRNLYNYKIHRSRSVAIFYCQIAEKAVIS